MKTRKTLLGTAILAVLAVSLALPLGTLPVSAQEEQVQATWRTEGNWTYIQNDVITIVFPAGGKKPMFLWWYTENPDNINVVKYKGLIEYVAFDSPYFLWRCQAEAWRIRERIQARYYEPRRPMLQPMQRLMALLTLLKIGNATGLHAPYLPFSAGKWELSDPVNVTRGDVKYLSFNFTLVDIPGHPGFQFAKGNIIIRCRFYYTPATENVNGLYTYSVNAGELKMDLIVKHWEWNIDKVEPLLQELRDQGFAIPKPSKAGVALWINLASINLTKLPVAEEDITTPEDTSYVESSSTAKNMYVEGQRVAVTQNEAAAGIDEHPLQNRLKERFKFRFERGNATLAGFFKFVPKAIVTNNTNYETVNVTASYIAADAHMRLFLGYPYFGNKTLEHDPSLGLEAIPSLISPQLVTILIGTVAVIAAVVFVARWRKRVINVVGVR